MANMFDTVKKQGEQLDGLQQKVSNNTERIETLETRSQATPPAQPAAVPEVTVVVPDNIATKESLVKLLEIAIKNQTQVTVNTISNMLKPVLKQISDLGIELDDSIIETIAQKCSDKAFSKRYSQLEDSAERLNYRISNLVNGTIWASIPRWFYVSFVVFFIAACAFGYGFFHLLNQNDRLTEVEWLYRRERTYYRTDEDKGILSNNEREFLTGTFHEQDSIKNLIRHWEHKYGADKTYLYFNPTED